MLAAFGATGEKDARVERHALCQRHHLPDRFFFVWLPFESPGHSTKSIMLFIMCLRQVQWIIHAPGYFRFESTNARLRHPHQHVFIGYHVDSGARPPFRPRHHELVP